MEHPNSEYQKKQKEFLDNCPENQKAFVETNFRIGNAAYIYHQHATSVSEKNSRLYYQEWLQGLPAEISSAMKIKGFENCRTMVPFMRYINEREDIGMTEWMKEHLSEADFNHYQKSNE